MTPTSLPTLLLLLSLPCLLWTQGPDSAPALKEAGVDQICVPADAGTTASSGNATAGAGAADAAAAWRAAGVSVRVLDASDVASREALTTPGITARAGLASPTRVPWVTANGWQFRRKQADRAGRAGGATRTATSAGNASKTGSAPGRYAYDVPAGRGALAAAEAFAYGADAVLKIDPADLPDVGRMLAFLRTVPAADLPDLADFAVVDDGSPLVGEVLNLLERRNLLFQIVHQPSPRFRINVAVGSTQYPQADAADPSAFALKVRRALTDARRSLRVYGSEVVIARLTGNAHRVRLHLLNYSGRDIQGLRIRLRGRYREAHTFSAAGAGSGGGGTAASAGTATSGSPSAAPTANAGAGPDERDAAVTLTDFVTTGGATEFSVPSIGVYTVVDLTPLPSASRPARSAAPASQAHR
jgi:hypothetical protein